MMAISTTHLGELSHLPNDPFRPAQHAGAKFARPELVPVAIVAG